MTNCRKRCCPGVNRLTVESEQSSPLILSRPSLEFLGASEIHPWVNKLAGQSPLFTQPPCPERLREGRKHKCLWNLWPRATAIRLWLSPRQAHAGRDQTPLAVLTVKIRPVGKTHPCSIYLTDAELQFPSHVIYDMGREPYLGARFDKNSLLTCKLLEKCKCTTGKTHPGHIP